jgi:hypothetical protein
MGWAARGSRDRAGDRADSGSPAGRWRPRECRARGCGGAGGRAASGSPGYSSRTPAGGWRRRGATKRERRGGGSGRARRRGGNTRVTLSRVRGRPVGPGRAGAGGAGRATTPAARGADEWRARRSGPCGPCLARSTTLHREAVSFNRALSDAGAVGSAAGRRTACGTRPCARESPARARRSGCRGQRHETVDHLLDGLRGDPLAERPPAPGSGRPAPERSSPGPRAAKV